MDEAIRLVARESIIHGAVPKELEDNMCELVEKWVRTFKTYMLPKLRSVKHHVK